MDESKPNWRVRSDTEMAKELYMSETEATMMTIASTAARFHSEFHSERSLDMPWLPHRMHALDLVNFPRANLRRRSVALDWTAL